MASMTIRLWVAEVDGQTVGRAEAFMNFFSTGSRTCFVGVTVRSDHRRCGIGSQLYELRQHVLEFPLFVPEGSFVAMVDGIEAAVSLLVAAEHGITQISTDNDETNAPMLAINRRLGYKPVGRRVEYLRESV
jgi:GNAT superfamily N-acetyltransferase